MRVHCRGVVITRILPDYLSLPRVAIPRQHPTIIFCRACDAPVPSTCCPLPPTVSHPPPTSTLCLVPLPPLSAHPLPFYPGPRRVPRRARSRLVTLWSWEWGCVCSCYGKCCGCASLCVFVALCVVLSLLSSSPPLYRPANACTSTVVASIYRHSFVRERSTYTFRLIIFFPCPHVAHLLTFWSCFVLRILFCSF